MPKSNLFITVYNPFTIHSQSVHNRSDFAQKSPPTDVKDGFLGAYIWIRRKSSPTTPKNEVIFIGLRSYIHWPTKLTSSGFEVNFIKQGTKDPLSSIHHPKQIFNLLCVI